MEEITEEKLLHEVLRAAQIERVREDASKVLDIKELKGENTDIYFAANVILANPDTINYLTVGNGYKELQQNIELMRELQERATDLWDLFADTEWQKWYEDFRDNDAYYVAEQSLFDMETEREIKCLKENPENYRAECSLMLPNVELYFQNEMMPKNITLLQYVAPFVMDSTFMKAIEQDDKALQYDYVLLMDYSGAVNKIYIEKALEAVKKNPSAVEFVEQSINAYKFVETPNLVYDIIMPRKRIDGQHVPFSENYKMCVDRDFVKELYEANPETYKYMSNKWRKVVEAEHEKSIKEKETIGDSVLGDEESYAVDDKTIDDFELYSHMRDDEEESYSYTQNDTGER